MSGPRPWYDDAFGSLYSLVYAHRSDEQARREVRFVIDQTGIRAGDPVLDLGCGNGRHLRAFAGMGIPAIGLDRSASLLAEARKCHGLVRGDVRRLPFAEQTFSLAVSFFTSFGYFPTVEEDQAAMREACRALAPGGWYFLDFLRAENVEQELVPSSERSVGDLRVVEERRIEGDRVLKRVRVYRGSPGPLLDYEESVRLYGKDELERLAAGAGLRVETWFAGFAETERQRGPRRCMLARRPS